MLVRCQPPIRRTINIRSLHATPRRLQREQFDPHNVERVSDDVDVCIVGGGPAGLSAAIRLKQLEQEKGKEIRVVVLEKGAEVGEFVYNWFQLNKAGANCNWPTVGRSWGLSLLLTYFKINQSITLIYFLTARFAHTFRGRNRAPSFE